MPARPDLTGRRFGRLTVIRYKESRRNRRYWECLCLCGKTTIIATNTLTSGHTESCGCLFGERHGLRKTTEYRSWLMMKNRCYNPRCPKFVTYRDLGVCERWRNSFLAFLEDMGRKPPSTSIERLNNSEGYNCGHCEDCLSRGVIANCIWANGTTQARNKRNNHKITFNGETLCISEWAERTGMSQRLLWHRLVKRGWLPEKAFSTPVNHNLGHRRP